MCGEQDRDPSQYQRALKYLVNELARDTTLPDCVFQVSPYLHAPYLHARTLARACLVGLASTGHHGAWDD